MDRTAWESLLRSALPFALALGFASPSWAVPSFARQTGLACNACHTVAPQLNAFGRFFKLHGYVMGSEKLSGGTSQLSIDKFPPLSAMIILSDTQTSKAQPDTAIAGAGSQNGSASFPQQLSVFYAGAIAQQMGAFAQLTYTQSSDHFTMDNTDIRYAQDVTWDDGQAMVWGVTVNNNPTVQDVWNSTPAWSFRFISSSVAPSPNATPLLAGPLAQNVAGIGTYAWLNNSWYGEFTLYRSSKAGQAQPYDSTASNVISGLAPYGRVAWEHAWAGEAGQHDFEVGLMGMSVHQFPGNTHPLFGLTDDYRDTGVDAQYQYIKANDSLAVHANYIHEQQNLNASNALGLSGPSDHLNYWNVNASYYWDGAYGPTLGYFGTSGSTDPLLYTPAPLTGSALGSPASSGWIAQWTWLPVMNVQVTAQYTIYSKFNGGSSNYDGSGRNASDNNTLYLALWVLW
ncbi:MAG TPA: cytochrome C [Gammaproteobacteria bacterium]|nr:cytochrome C [Gammaproteobacteria bacterium]